MKFYYNNELVRTSKSRHYKYAAIWVENDKVYCYGCSETIKGAESAKRGASYQQRLFLESAERSYKAVLSGRTFYCSPYGGRVKCTKTADEYKADIEKWQAAINRCNENIKIVEIEERA